MVQNDPVVGHILHFDPFSLEINKRGEKKVENQPSPNLLFKTQDDIIIKEVLPSYFVMKRGSGRGVVA
jgi:hypothetical protein